MTSGRGPGGSRTPPGGASLQPPLDPGAPFRRLWTGQSVSLLGMHMGDVAVKLLAAAVLAATPFQLGLLSMAQTGGFLLFGLLAGVMVDRLPRRPILVVCDLVRAVLLGSIPLAWWLGYLSLAYLLAVSLLVSVTAVLFEVAYRSVLPSIIAAAELPAANGKLESTRSTAQAAGPAVGGVAADAFGAANAVGISALAHFAAACLFLRMRIDEPARSDLRTGKTLRADIAEGLRFVLTHRVLRSITAAAAMFNFCYGILLPLVIALLVTELALPSSTVGWLLACAGIGGICGAVIAQVVVTRLGMARSICMAEAVTGPACLLLVTGTGSTAVATFALGYLALHLALSIFNVAQVSFRQALCPPHLLGRMNASVRFLMWGALPLGGLAGGVLATVLSVRTGILFAAAGLVLAAVVLFLSPLWRLRSASIEELQQGGPAGSGKQQERP